MRIHHGQLTARAFAAAAILGLIACSDAEPGRDASAGPGPRCAAPTVWPALPTVAAIREPAGLSGAEDSARVALDTVPPDTSVTVPQYAFFRHADGNVCEPVIVVKASRTAIAYLGVDLTSRGSADRELVELLGTTPRAGRR